MDTKPNSLFYFLSRLAIVQTLLLIFFTSSGHAALINLNLTGTVTSSSGVLAGAYSVGTAFSSAFSYEDTTADINASPEIGGYLGGLTAFSVNLGGTSWSMSSASTVTVFDQPNNSRWSGATTSATSDLGSLNPGAALFMSIDFISSDGSLFTDDGINQSALNDPTQFSSTIALRVIENSVPTGFAVLTLTSTGGIGGTGGTVPEPGALLLVLLGLTVLLTKRKDQTG